MRLGIAFTHKDQTGTIIRSKGIHVQNTGPEHAQAVVQAKSLLVPRDAVYIFGSRYTIGPFMFKVTHLAPTEHPWPYGALDIWVNAPMPP